MFWMAEYGSWRKWLHCYKELGTGGVYVFFSSNACAFTNSDLAYFSPIVLADNILARVMNMEFSQEML